MVDIFRTQGFHQHQLALKAVFNRFRVDVNVLRADARISRPILEAADRLFDIIWQMIQDVVGMSLDVDPCVAESNVQG